MTKQEDVLAPYRAHGVDFTRQAGDEWIGTALFCPKPDKFQVNIRKQVWKDWVAGSGGKLDDFLEEMAALYEEDLDHRTLTELAQNRGLPIRAFRGWGLGYDSAKRAYTIPGTSIGGRIGSIRWWSPRWKGSRNTKGCKTQLFGTQRLIDAAPGSTVWLCEGEWDTIALAFHLGEAGQPSAIVVGVPGAGTFKPEWARLFRGHHVRICFDNDDAGRQGAEKAVAQLRPLAASLRTLTWAEGAPEKYDIRDFVVACIEEGSDPGDRLAELEAMLREVGSSSHTSPRPPLASEATPPTFSQLLKVFDKHLYMTADHRTALALTLAVARSAETQGTVLWLFLVAPPGAGKTAILNSLRDSPRAEVLSRFSAKSLVSGYQGEDEETCLALRVNGRCLVLKDYTEVLGMHPHDRASIYATLRGAYDGQIYNTYGNAVVRDFDTRFSMVAGVTPKIHTIQDTDLGARFLKFNFATLSAKDTRLVIGAALDATQDQTRGEQVMREAVTAFLHLSLDSNKIPRFPRRLRGRLIALAQLIAWLRAIVDRDQYSRELRGRPFVEVAARLAQQLARLAEMLACILGKTGVDGEVYEIIERVAFDTAQGFNLDLVQAIGRHAEGVTIKDLAEEVGLPPTTSQSALGNLLQLGAVQKEKHQGERRGARGVKPDLWKLSAEVKALWEEAGVVTDHSVRLASTRPRREKPSRLLLRKRRRSKGS